MKHAKTIWIGLALLAVIIIVVIGITHKKSVSNPETIKIGAVLSLTGAASQDGESIKNGIELARKELREKGVNVDVEYQDDGTDSKKTVSAIEFLSAQNVQAVIGPTWSFLGDAGAPVLTQKKLVGFEPADTSEYSTPDDYVFFGSTKVGESKNAIRAFLLDHQVKTIVYVANQGGWGEANRQTLVAATEGTDAHVTRTEMIPWGSEAQTVSTLLTKIKAEDPDLIVASFDNDEGIINLLQKIRQYGMKTTILAATTSFDRVIKTQEVVKGIKVPVYTLMPKPSDEFVKNYVAEYGKNPGAYADTAYDGLMLLTNGLQKKTASQTLNEYLKSSSYKGFAKTYSFDAKNDVVGGEWTIQKTN